MSYPRFVSPPPRKPSLLEWWQRKSLLNKILTAIIGIPLALFVGSAVITGLMQGITGQTSTPTPGPTTAVQLAHVVTVTPTTRLVPTATPRPTPRPAPTAMPVVQPTQPPAPTQAPVPTQPPAKTGFDGNPYGYDLNSSGGQLIYNPPTDLCSYIPCIANFEKGRGYVIECQDGNFSKSGGIQGSCSHHGSDKQPLYAH